MKKILSLALAAVMLACSLTVTAVADDAADENIYVDADFSSDTAAAQHFYPGNFKSDGTYLTGYSDALAFQSIGAWSSYDVVFDAMFAEDDIVPEGTARSLSFVYINPNMKYNGLLDDDYLMSIVYDITKGEISLVGNSFFNDANADKIVDPVPFDFEDSTNYSFGISVSEGQIRVFVDGELIIDFVDEENKYFIGYSYEEVVPSIMLWWNAGGCTAFEDVKISVPGYLLPFPKPVMYGDATGDEKINLADVSLMLKHIAKWGDLELDLVAADVTNDEKINLADVSLMLKYIAKWEYIVLGPHEKHSFGEWTVVEPTLTEEGSKTHTCLVCGETETEVIPVLTPDAE